MTSLYEATTGQLIDQHSSSEEDLCLRISAIFVIFIASLLGAWLPLFASRREGRRGNWVFGSGVIVATAFIHLLAPASEALTDPSLNNEITGYPWAELIALVMITLMFFVEVIVMRQSGARSEELSGTSGRIFLIDPSPSRSVMQYGAINGHRMLRSDSMSSVLGIDHFSHERVHAGYGDLAEHSEHCEHMESCPRAGPYAAQLVGLFILEFGIIFHSIFIGLTLGVSGEEFKALYTVLVFHQAFEGLGLGARLASVPFGHAHRWTPHVLVLAYGVSTPGAAAIGLGIRSVYRAGSPAALIMNGVFDAISAGILIYTGLVELMAHEFMFSPEMSNSPLKEILGDFACFAGGIGLMTLLGVWI